MNNPPPQIRRNVRAANRDAAQQVATLRGVIERHAEELALLLRGTGTCSDDPSVSDMCMLFDAGVLAERLAAERRNDQKLLLSELQQAKRLGEWRRLAVAPSAASIATLAEAFPHFELVIDLVRQQTALAAVTPGRVFTLPPILLSGDPGVGKTAFSEVLARTLSVPTRRVDMATSTASFALGGSHSSWSAAKPGAVWALLQAHTCSGLLLLDELDKATDGNYPATGPLYGLLERSSARHFRDEFIDLEVDASHLMCIATCNDPNRIEDALRSRLIEIEIPLPTAEQMVAIARSIYRERHRHAAWGQVFPDDLPEDVAAAAGTATPRELAGLLEAAVARAASERRFRLLPSDLHHARLARSARRRAPAKLGFI